MRKLSWLIIIVVGLAILAGYSFFYGQNSFRVRDVELVIEGPIEVNSGEEVNYLIKFNNNTKVILREAELVFESQSYNLGDLLANSEGQIEVNARVLGQPDEEQELKAALYYQPENFSSSFEARANLMVKIISSAVLLSLEAPEQVVSGSEQEYVLTLVSKSEEAFKNLELFYDFPDDFLLTSELVNSIDLSPNEVRTVKFTGFVTGQEGEEKTLTVRLGEIAAINSGIIISGSPLSLQSEMKGQALPGERLEFIINWQNYSDVEFSDGGITIELNGTSWDFNSIEVNDGSFDKFQKKITWTRAGVEELAAIKSGQVKFKASVKNRLSINTFNDKNFVLLVRGVLETKEKVSANFEQEIKINSELDFQTRAYFNEPAANIQNSGPIPPQAGQLTNYTIHWQLANGANDLENVLISASLPANISWTGQNQINQGRLYYDSESNLINWEIGQIPAHTGSLLPAYEAVFQIALKPTPNQVGKLAPLINTSLLSSKDSFTEQILTTRTFALSSELPDDPTISYQQGIVVE